uniref:UAE_UbL domain-containing protein n=1 Tax=Glossina brevipalpis TaxID=37001 RepID=A0A1A9W1J4_9MUSC
MINPDGIIDSKSVVLNSSEEDETECNEEKFMKEMDIVDGIILKCDDFSQNYELSIIIVHIDTERECSLFEVIATKDQLKPKEENVPNKRESMADGPLINDDLCIIEVENECVKAQTEDACVQTSETEMVTKATNTMRITSSSPDKPISAVKRKIKVVDIIDDDVVTEILDYDEEVGPTKVKRTRVSKPQSNHWSEDIINID